MNDQGLLALGLGLFATGFLGSWHCAAMCGPIACLAQNRGQLVAYHFGRVLSYSLIGALAGALGSTLFHHQTWWVRAASFTVLGVLILILTLQLVSSLIDRPLGTAAVRGNKKPSWFKKYGTRSGFGLGFLSILLPCAWLYTFVAGAAATQSGWAGGLIMFFFALSSIPALSVAPQFFARTLKGSPLRQKVLSLAVLSFAAIYALVAHFIF